MIRLGIFYFHMFPQAGATGSASKTVPLGGFYHPVELSHATWRENHIGTTRDSGTPSSETYKIQQHGEWGLLSCHIILEIMLGLKEGTYYLFVDISF